MSTFTEVLTKLDSMLGRLTPTMGQYQMFKEALESIRARILQNQAEVEKGCQAIFTEMTKWEPLIKNCLLEGQLKELIDAQKATTTSA